MDHVVYLKNCERGQSLYPCVSSTTLSLWNNLEFSEFLPPSRNVAETEAIVYHQKWTRHSDLFIYLFEVLCSLQHCTGHIMAGNLVDRGNHYIQLVKVLYCKRRHSEVL